MRAEIVAPQLGLMEEVALIEWLRSDGDVVAKGEVVAVIQTDKANAELESPADGRLEIAVAASTDPVPVDTVFGYVVSEDG